jgi:uncharacterized protein YkwD
MRTTMRTKIGRIALVATVAAVLVGAFTLPGSANTGRYRDRWQMLRATNGSRFHHELRRVDLSKKLSRIAKHHSAKMADRNTLFHTSNPGSVYLKGVRWHYWGENVGVTGGDVGDLETAFMKSAPHRWNILNRSYDHVAIGTVRDHGTLWVTVFFWG